MTSLLGTGRCDDVIMQSRNEGKELHLYHSVKGGAPPPGDGIRHVVSTDNGKTWSSSELVLSAALQPGHSPAESIAGKYMPAALGGKGAMVLITDGGTRARPYFNFFSFLFFPSSFFLLLQFFSCSNSAYFGVRLKLH